MNRKLLIEAHKVSDFITENYPDNEPQEDPVGYAGWYISNGFLAYVTDNDGKILALGAARPVKEPEDGLIPYRYDDDGNCIFIDMLITRGIPIAMPSLMVILRRRFGRRDWMAYASRKNKHVVVKDFDTFVRNFERRKKEYEPT
jgi:hypothetical protein